MANSKAEIPIHIVEMSGTASCGDSWELHPEGTLHPPTWENTAFGIPQTPEGTVRFPGLREPTNTQPPRHTQEGHCCLALFHGP